MGSSASSSGLSGSSAVTKSDSPGTQVPAFSYAMKPPPLLVPVSQDHLVYGNGPGLARQGKCGSHPLRRSNSDGSRLTTKISQGSRAYTKPVRRITLHDLDNVEPQIADKRHGFVMPCIVRPILIFVFDIC